MEGPGREEDVLRTWLVRLGQLGLTVGVTWIIVERVGLDLGQLGALDASAWVPQPLLLGAASLLLLAAYLASATLWGLIVHDLGGPRLGVAESARMFMIANLGRYVPGKVWQIAGLAALAKGRGVAAPTATGAAVLGQGLALVAASAVGMGAFLGGPEAYRRWGIVGAIAVGATGVLLAIPSVFEALAGVWFRITRTEARKDLRGVHALRWLALYLVTWTTYSLSFWVLAMSLGLDGGLVPVASAFAAAYVLGYAMVFAPAGLGPREGFLIVFLTPHIGAPASGALAIVARVWTTVIEIAPAGVFWLRHVAVGASAGPRVNAEGGDA